MSILRSSARGIGYPLAALLAVATLPVVGPVLIALNYRGLADRLSRVPGIESGGGPVSGVVAVAYVALVAGAVGAVATGGGPLVDGGNETTVPVTATATEAPTAATSTVVATTEGTGTPSLTPTDTVTSTVTPTPTPATTPTGVPTPTAPETPSPTATPTPKPTATPTPSPTATPTPTPTATPTATPAPSSTPHSNFSTPPSNFTELYIETLEVNEGVMISGVRIRGVERRGSTLYIVHNATDGHQNSTKRTREQFALATAYSTTIVNNDIHNLSFDEPSRMKYLEYNSTSLSHQPRTSFVEIETVRDYLEDGNDIDLQTYLDMYMRTDRIATDEEVSLAEEINRDHRSFVADGSESAPPPEERSRT